MVVGVAAARGYGAHPTDPGALVRLRLATPADRPRLDDICLRTGAAGGDARDRHAEPGLLGEVFVGPYLALAPDLAFVAEDPADGAVVGYVLGVADTEDFEDACERNWWPGARARHPLGEEAGTAADRALIARIHAPPRTDPEVAASHPAHLHVDLLPRAQGHGLGRRLVEHLLGEFAARGVGHVHLGVARANTRAVGFYRRLGFTVLQQHPDSLVLGRATA